MSAASKSTEQLTLHSRATTTLPRSSMAKSTSVGHTGCCWDENQKI